MTIVTLINPFSKAIVERDISDMTDQDLEGFSLDQEICEQIHGTVDTAPEFFEKYIELAGIEAASSAYFS